MARTRVKDGAQGRPVDFTAALAAEICRRLCQGLPLVVVCEAPEMPEFATAAEWQEHDAEFARAVARSWEAGCDRIALEMLRIADDSTQDTIEGRSGPVPDKEWILRSKLRIDTRMRLLAKWYPRRYGDRSSTDPPDGADGGEGEPERSEEDMAAFAGLMAEARRKLDA